MSDRFTARAEAIAAERQIATNEAASAAPDAKLSAAAKAMAAAAQQKRAQQMQHPKDAPAEGNAFQAQETPADEEATAAPAEGDDQGDPNAEGAEPAEGQAITVNGKRLTAEEIARDYIPKAEYTRKTMAFAEQQKQFGAAAQARLQRLDQQIEALHADVGQEPDWLQVAQEKGNDVAFSEQLAWSAKNRKLQQAAIIRRQESEQLVRQQIAERDAFLAENYNTAWNDSSARAKDYEAIAKYAFSEGFTEEETQLMTAPRYLVTLDKARKYDEAMKAGKLAAPGLSKKPAVLKPGARNPQSTVKNPVLDKALERFNLNPTREGYLETESLRRSN